MSNIKHVKNKINTCIINTTLNSNFYYQLQCVVERIFTLMRRRVAQKNHVECDQVKMVRLMCVLTLASLRMGVFIIT